MELTASRVRAAGWLPLLYFGLMFLVNLVTGGEGEPSGATKIILTMVNALASAALYFYVLTVFRQLLNEWYGYRALDNPITYAICLYFFNALLTLAFFPFAGAQWLEYVDWVIILTLAAVQFEMSRTLLNKPVLLFGYGRKLALSSMTIFVCIGIDLATMAIAFPLAGFDLAHLGDLPILLYVPAFFSLLVAMVALIYFIIISVRMFFAAARTMDRARPPEEALATG